MQTFSKLRFVANLRLVFFLQRVVTLFYIYFSGNGSKLQEGTESHECTKLHKNNFAPRVNFAQVRFLQESKKKQKKKLKHRLIKKKRKLLTEGKG